METTNPSTSFDLELRTRLFQISSIIVAAIFFVGGTVYLFTGLSYFFGSILVCSSLITLSGLILFKRNVHVDKLVWLLIFLCYLNDMLGWIYLAGHNGSAPMMFVALTLLSITLVPHRQIIYLLVGAFFLAFGILTLETIYPQIIVPYASPELEKTDKVFILLLGLTTVTSIAFFFRSKIVSVANMLKLKEEKLEESVTMEMKKVRELKDAEKKLLEANASLEEYAHITSHDLQEPLATIHSIADVIQEDYADNLDENGKKYLQFLSRSAARLRSQISSILKYSTLGNNIHLEQISPTELIESIKSELDDLLKKRHATISYSNLPATVISGKTELQITLQNLIINGIKYNTSDRPAVNIMTETKGDDYLFCVADNGIGIDEKDLESVFTLFKRIDSKSEGTGIGLANAKKVIVALGGKIWAESTKDKGSRFYFTIPR